jgi:restriction endonuclease Mrr
MPCDTRLKPKQTISERAQEVREAVARIVKQMAQGKVRVVVDKSTGAVAFAGLSATDRDGVTDACAYRRIMSGTSQLAKAAIARAEAMAGKKVNTQAVAQGVHSHDGGTTWHNGH